MTSVRRKSSALFLCLEVFSLIKKTVSVGIGGMLGTLLRYALFQVPLPGGILIHVLITMGINVSGSFFLGFLVILFVRKIPASAEIRLAVTTGFLGGYTTFSTMCKDMVTLLQSGFVLPAFLYLALTVLLGLAASWGGIRAGKRLEGRRAS
jgi:CrcB protein